MKTIRNFLLVFLLVFVSCTKEDKSNFKPIDAGLNGFVQKGPFISGSSITIQELDESFSPNGKTYSTITNDDLGSFKLKSLINSQYIEVIAQGFYYNEVLGNLSPASLSLRTVLKTSSSIISNVNILTTLSENRIIYLVNEKGKSFEDAKHQSEAEILKIFGISEDSIQDFNQMDISKSGNSNAILIAISSILQGTNSVAELSELISKIIIDIKEDGILDDIKYLNILKDNSKALNLFDIRENLKNRYEKLGLEVTIPNFENYAKRLIPLTVNSTIPLLNEKNVDRNTSISVKFNKPIDVSSISNNSFIITNESLIVSGTYSYIKDTYEIVFKPDSLLSPLTTYTISLNNSLKGLDGLPLENNYSATFVTETFDIVNNLSNYYIFSGNFADQSGNNGDAVPTGVNFSIDRFNIDNSAILFNGNNNYIDIPRTINPVNSEWTFSIWFKLNQLPSTHDDAFFLTRQAHDDESDIYLYVDDADNMIKTGIVNGHIKLSSGVVVVKDQWYNAIMTYSANSIFIYVNGELMVTSNDRFTCNMPSGEPFRVSCIYNGSWGDLPDEGRIYGAIDDIRLYERCLNSREVKLLYSNENGGKIKSNKILISNSSVGVSRSLNKNWQ